MASLTAMAGLSLHLLGEEGLLLDPARQRLYALNPCATFIWSLLKDGCSPEQTSRSLAETFALPSEAATAYVADVLSQYESLRRDEAAGSPQAPESSAMTMPAADAMRHGATRYSATRYEGPLPGAVLRTYRLLDSVFRLRFASAPLFETVRANLEKFVAWISTSDCFDLPLASLDRGTGLLDELCA